jgi:hypothetical protein
LYKKLGSKIYKVDFFPRDRFIVTGINVKVDLFNSMLFYLMDTFAPKRLARVTAGNDLSGVRNWLDDRVVLAIRERNDLDMEQLSNFF